MAFFKNQKTKTHFNEVLPLKKITYVDGFCTRQIRFGQILPMVTNFLGCCCWFGSVYAACSIPIFLLVNQTKKTKDIIFVLCVNMNVCECVSGCVISAPKCVYVSVCVRVNVSMCAFVFVCAIMHMCVCACV